MEIYHVLSIILMIHGLLGAKLLSSIPEDVMHQLPTEVKRKLDSLNLEKKESVEEAMARLLSEEDPVCVFEPIYDDQDRITEQSADDLSKDEKFLDSSINVKCNDYETGMLGSCNCPAGTACGFTGEFEEEKRYFCKGPPKPEYWTDGLILGPNDGPPQVIVQTGADPIPIDPEYVASQS